MKFSLIPDLNFASPEYFYGLMLIPLLWIAKVWADGRSRKIGERLISSHRLRNLLVSNRFLGRSWTQFLLQTLALALWILAMTQPQYGVVQQETFTRGRNILLAIDTSKSMLATDVPPNRLTRAKLAAEDIIAAFPSDRIGLIAFAGGSFLQAPLTDDHSAVLESIGALDYQTIPRGGSSLAGAIKLAAETFKDIKSDQNGLIILSDGQETDEGASTAAEAAAKNLVIVTVGIGTEEGDILLNPDSDEGNDYIRDREGNIVTSRLETAVLQEVASKTQGRFIPLTSNAAAKAAVDQVLQQLSASETTAKKTEKPIERFQWPLALGIGFFLLSLLISGKPSKLNDALAPLPTESQATLSRHSTVISLLAFFLASTSVFGVQTHLKEANAAFDQEKYKKAEELYRKELESGAPSSQRPLLEYASGAADYYQKDYDSAIQRFSQSLLNEDPLQQSKAQQGIGSSLYYQGLKHLQKSPKQSISVWKEAVDHYNRAIELSHEKEPLIENRDFIQNLLKEVEKQEEQKEKEKQEQQKQQQEQKGDQKGEQNDSGEKQDSESKDGQSPEQNESGEKSESKPNDAGMQEGKQEPLPEGELKAGEEGEEADKEAQSKQTQGDADDVQDEKTGFTPNEARAQLKNYSNDQKTIQYMQRRERAPIGKDY